MKRLLVWLTVLAAASTLLLVAGGCGDKIEEIEGRSVRVSVRVRAADNPDALAGVGSFEVTVRTDRGRERTFPLVYAMDRLSCLPGNEGCDVMDFGEGGLDDPGKVRLTLWSLDEDFGADRVSVGRSGWVDVPEPPEDAIEAGVFLGVPERWSRIGDGDRWRRPALSRSEGEHYEAGAAVSLEDGRVLMAGGRAGDDWLPALLYDLFTGNVEILSDGPRAIAPALAPLGRGTAVVAGGLTEDGPSGEVWFFDGKELRLVEDTIHASWAAAAAYFPESGVVVVAGGYGTGSLDSSEAAAVDTISVIRPVGDDLQVDGTTDALASGPRAQASVTRLEGFQDPATGSTAYLIAGGLSEQEGPPISNGEVLVMAADGGSVVAKATAGGSHFETMGVGRVGHIAAALPSGRVFITGGADGNGVLADPEPVVFAPERADPGGFIPLTPAGSGGGAAARADGWAAPLPDGSVLVGGGADDDGSSPPAFIFELPSGQDFGGISEADAEWLPPPEDAQAPRVGAHTVVMPGGELLLIGGRHPDGWLHTRADVFVACADADEPDCEL